MPAAAAVFAVLLAALPASAQTPRPLTTSASVKLSSARAGVRPVTVTLVLGYEMQCGYPGPGPIVVGFPAQERLPARIATTAVLLDGHAATAVRISGHRVSVGLAPAPRIMCDVIGVGKLTIVFTRSAALGNPLHAGSYALTASRGTSAFSAPFTIRAS